MWVNRYDNFNNSIERISKKYQWIAYYEILAKLVDKFPDVQYSGLWDDYIRDIDPTLLLLEIDKIKDDNPHHFLRINRMNG